MFGSPTTTIHIVSYHQFLCADKQPLSKYIVNGKYTISNLVRRHKDACYVKIKGVFTLCCIRLNGFDTISSRDKMYVRVLPMLELVKQN